MDKRGKAKVPLKLKAAMEKCELIHPSRSEEEAYELFKGLNLQEKEEQIQEREVGDSAICNSVEFFHSGIPEILKSKNAQVQALSTQEYDPLRDERTFGCCMKAFLCLCFCAC